MKSDISMDTAKLGTIVSSLEGKIALVEEIFNNIDNNMKNFDGNCFWKGKTQESVYSGYVDLAKGFPVIVDQLKKYTSFLKTTISDYTKTENAIDDAIDSNSDDLDVN